METKSQNNELEGTEEYLIKQYASLKQFLELKGIDVDRYDPIGVDIFNINPKYFSGSIICRDHERSTNDKSYMTKFTFKRVYKQDVYFEFLKKFRILDCKEYHISEEFII